MRAWIDYSVKDGTLYFWRTKSGLEVDFIVYGEIGFYALEVKNSKSVKPEDLRSLQEFKKDYPQCICLLLYRGEQKRIFKGILCLPIADFLLNLMPNEMMTE